MKNKKTKKALNSIYKIIESVGLIPVKNTTKSQYQSADNCIQDKVDPYQDKIDEYFDDVNKKVNSIQNTLSGLHFEKAEQILLEVYNRIKLSKLTSEFTPIYKDE